MAIESITHILEEIDWEGIIRKIIGQKPEGALDTEQVSLTPAGPVEEAAGGDAPPAGDELARQNSWLFWQKFTGLQGDVQALIRDLNHGVPQDISSEVEAGKALVSEFDALMDKYDPNNPFITTFGRDAYSEIEGAKYELEKQLAFLETAREQLDNGTLNEVQRQVVLDSMKDAKEALVQSLKSIKFNVAIRQA